jgi:predicted ATPase
LRLKPLLMKLWLSARSLVASGVSYASSLALNLSLKLQEPVAKAKKSAYVSVDETQVKIDIVKHLTEFFKLQEQLATHIREEEEKSLTVYDPDQNHIGSGFKEGDGTARDGCVGGADS